MVSRQYKWQLKQREAGNCKICGKKAVNKKHCEEHRIKYNEMARN